jgi:hypothetical protein
MSKLSDLLKESGVATLGRDAVNVIVSIPKEPKIANVDKLRAAARNYLCMYCGKAGETVAAHCNDVRAKGIGKKSPGYMLAYLCTECHDLVDGRKSGLSKAAKRAMWLEAYWLTVQVWFRDGLVKVT